MYVSEITLYGIRSFESAQIGLARNINVFVGANNSGKSTLLRSVVGLQYFPPFDVNSDLRQPYGGARPLTEATIVDCHLEAERTGGPATLRFQWDGQTIRAQNLQTGQVVAAANGAIFTAEAPKNAIYPYLSRRKAVAYGEVMNAAESLAVRDSLVNLNAKLDYVTNPDRPSYGPFTEACEQILGLRVSAVASPSGKRAGYVIDNFKQIPVVAMGEGVANIVGLLVDLFVANGQIFVIEELENDIHPAALKQLLRLIALSATRNQFLISTHSNIVVRQLCAEPGSKLFHVSMRLENRIPTSTVDEVATEPVARRAVLEELGYEFADFDLHAAWLFLEESSAEQLIRDYLVPWFAPKLAGRLRTFAAGGVNNIDAKFTDFDRLFVFLHLEPAYKNRAWVIVDAGDAENEIVASLRSKWGSRGWAAENFQQFNEHDFERYYPARFRGEIDAACAVHSDGTRKRHLKSALLKQIVAWIEEHPADAKAAFRTSAAEVIANLQRIESAVAQRN